MAEADPAAEVEESIRRSLEEAWPIAEIKERIRRRLAEIGKTMEDLPAGVRKGFEQGRPWQNGPTYRTLQTTAEILGLSVVELLGGSPKPPAEPSEHTLTTALRIAIDLMVPADNECLLRLQPERVAKITCLAYSMLINVAHDRPDLAYANGYELVLSIIRRAWEARDLEKS